MPIGSLELGVPGSATTRSLAAGFATLQHHDHGQPIAISGATPTSTNSGIGRLPKPDDGWVDHQRGWVRNGRLSMPTISAAWAGTARTIGGVLTNTGTDINAPEYRQIWHHLG